MTAGDDDGVRTTATVSVRVYSPGGTNGDGVVNVLDAVTMGGHWQTSRDEPGYSGAADLNNDGVVNIFNAVIVGRNWQDRVG